MADPAREGDIAKNLRTVEWLKSEMVGGGAQALRAMVMGNEDALLDGLATEIISAYVLTRRLGLGFERLDWKISNKLRLNIEEGHETEKWYGDLSALLSYLEDRKR